MYVRPSNTRTEMHAGRVACCPLMSDVEYALRALLRLENETRQTDGQTPERYITLTARRGQRENKPNGTCWTNDEHHLAPLKRFCDLTKF